MGCREVLQDKDAGGKKKKKEGHMSREGTALSCVVASSNNEDGTSLEATFPV